MKIIVVGGGWAGCSAAYFARKDGANVTLVERTDMLLGTGLVGGIMKNNGRLTAEFEAVALGLGDIFAVIDTVIRHKNVDFPGHRHASLYAVDKIEAVIRKVLEDRGVKLVFRYLASGVDRTESRLQAIYNDSDSKIEGDAFIDATGTAGPMKNCIRYGTGCAMCILRCPSFGPRISLTGLAGVRETEAYGSQHFEAMSGSCKLAKSSLDKALVKELEDSGVLKIPLPEQFYKKDSLHAKACQQYALSDYATNLVILDTGHAKIMTPYFPLENLHQLEGFEEARYADPYSGGQGNSVRFTVMSPCDNTLRVKGVKNLFCAGEKIGPVVGHTEAIISGALAGINAVRVVKGLRPQELPPELAVGDLIAFMHNQIKNGEGIRKKYTYSGSVYFDRMKEKGLYSREQREIADKIKKMGLLNLYL